jgi:hypothetical protein
MAPRHAGYVCRPEFRSYVDGKASAHGYPVFSATTPPCEARAYYGATLPGRRLILSGCDEPNRREIAAIARGIPGQYGIAVYGRVRADVEIRQNALLAALPPAIV